MRRVDCVARDNYSSIHVDADRILYCQRYRTSDQQRFLLIYLDGAAAPLDVIERADTLASLMPAQSADEARNV